jgi:hypothetical protein
MAKIVVFLSRSLFILDNYFYRRSIVSSMLEQAIIDAAALREAALKNAEQAIIEKYAPQIKEAVETLLEGDQPTDLLSEEESPIEAPLAANPMSTDQQVELSVNVEEPTYEFNLEDLKRAVAEDPESGGDPIEGTGELMSDLGLGDEAPMVEPPPAEAPMALEESAEQSTEDAVLQELLGLLEEAEAETEEDVTEEEVIEEELVVDTSEQKHGWIVTDEGTRSYDEELAAARLESTKVKEDNEGLAKKVEDLEESIKKFDAGNQKLNSVVKQLKEKLEESSLSNAKLIYSNRILSDASLNERQKSKIVEAIAQANTPEEAKVLCETLKATVGSTKKRGPKSLSESVQRRSNLSGIMPRRNNDKPQEDALSIRMRRLAGID